MYLKLSDAEKQAAKIRKKTRMDVGVFLNKVTGHYGTITRLTAATFGIPFLEVTIDEEDESIAG